MITFLQIRLHIRLHIEQVGRYCTHDGKKRGTLETVFWYKFIKLHEKERVIIDKKSHSAQAALHTSRYAKKKNTDFLENHVKISRRKFSYNKVHRSGFKKVQRRIR